MHMVRLSFNMVPCNEYTANENLGDGGEPDRGIVPIYALADGVSQFVVRSANCTYWFAANHELPEIYL